MKVISFLLLISSAPFLAVESRPGILQNIIHPQQSSQILQNTTPSNNSSDPFLLHKRQRATVEKTCGFLSGDSGRPRTAEPGFGCRVDTLNGLWGFCPTSVNAASDCGLAGACVDTGSCKSGCGKTGIPTLTTFTCSDNAAPFCSFAVLTAGPDQIYSYIACGKSAIREVYFAAATTTPVQSTSATSTRASTLPKTTTSSQPPSTSTSPQSQTSIPTTSASLLPATSSPPFTTTVGTPAETTRSIISIESSQPPNNIGAIVGGAIGGIALICLTVLGIFYLRKYQREHPAPESDVAVAPSPYVYRTTEAQTAGLHEKDAGGVLHEKDGERRSRRYTPFEMPG